MSRNEEYIPKRDDDFYNFIKTLIKILLQSTEGIINWQAWEIPEAKFKKLSELWNEYQKLYDKAQEKKNRDAGDVDDHREARKALEKYLRKFVNQYIRYEDQVPRGEKVRMGILPKDETPSPVHGTTSPLVKLKNDGGAIIDVECRRDKDQTRPSMLKGYNVELRWWALEKTAPPPTNPNKTGYAEELSSKAHFKVDADMDNQGKKFYCYVRWKHKSDSKFNSPWTDLMQITIS
ncbi:MAG: hypothetical protein HY841_00010 [Bacteroidetes bacterium]|nr:hypothetical protein [Bacteroidota bacterium]